MSGKSGKKPSKLLNNHEKLEAIRRVHEGQSKASVARDLGVPESTLRGWCKAEDKITKQIRQSSSPDTDGSCESKPKRRKTGEQSPPAAQPFNLSVKTTCVPNYSPTSDVRFVTDYAKNSLDAYPSTSTVSNPDNSKINLNVTEEEKNQLAFANSLCRMAEQPLSRENMQTLMQLAAMAPGYSWLQQQQVRKATQKTDTSNTVSQSKSTSTCTSLLTTVGSDSKSTSTIISGQKQSSADITAQWLNSHPTVVSTAQNNSSFIGMNGVYPLSVESLLSASIQNGSTTSIQNGSPAQNGYPSCGINEESLMAWCNRLSSHMAYRQATSHPQQVSQPISPKTRQSSTPTDKPILYQQLTREKEQDYPEDLSLKSDKNTESSASSRSTNASPTNSLTSSSLPSPSNISNGPLPIAGCSSTDNVVYFDTTPTIQNKVPSILNGRTATPSDKGMCNKRSNGSTVDNKTSKRKNGVDTILADLANNNEYSNNKHNGNTNNKGYITTDWKTAVQCGEYLLRFVDEAVEEDNTALSGVTHFEVSSIRKAIAKIRANGEAREVQ